jgi:hypothetical protein
MEASRGAAEGRSLRSAVIGALVGLALLVAPSGASAAAEADAGCPGPMDGTPLTPIGNFREAQTFTAGRTGGLQRVTIAITNLGGSANFLVQILPTDGNGVPTNLGLADTTIPATSVAQGPTTLDANFSVAAPVTAGQTYAVAVSRPGANPVVPLWQIQTRTAGTCPGSGFVSSDASAGWSPQPANADFIFQTYVDPALVTAGGKGGSGELTWTLLSKHGRLFAKVPAPGKLIVDDAKRQAQASRHHRRKKRGPNLVKRTTARAKKAGLVPLRIALTNKAVNLALKRRKLNITASVTYRPTGGQASTIDFRIRLRL